MFVVDIDIDVDVAVVVIVIAVIVVNEMVWYGIAWRWKYGIWVL